MAVRGSGHVVLLGDSIFDNAPYTGGDPDVVSHLRRLLPAAWKATLCAEDGATIADLRGQLKRVPEHASHLVISVGGNDALRNWDLLSLRVTSSSEVLDAFAARIAVFERAYRGAVEQAVKLQRYTAVCTVYNGALQQDATAARMGLALFNDVILRTAVEQRLDAVELRSICREPADYVNAIEPSGQGGLKLARAVARLIGATASPERPACVWGGA
jgi:hypothetical protein